MHNPVDARPGWQLLLDAIAAEVDPARRANLEVVAEHVVAETSGDLDAVMRTLTAEPSYEIWGASTSVGPQGADAVRENYARMIKTGKNRLDYDIGRVVADAHTVVTQGTFRFAYPGRALAATATAAHEPINPDDWYLVEYQCVIVWPIGDEGRISGEAVYAGEPPRAIRALHDGELDNLGPHHRRNGVVESW